MLANNGLPEIFAYGVLIGEILAPLMLIIGWRVRLAAVLLFINCLVAVLLVFPDQIFALGENGGWAIELLGLYMIGSLTLMFTGEGKLTVFQFLKIAE